MVIKSFEEIYNETEQKLGIKNKAVFIEHVKGHLKLSEKSILIGVACKHRDEAYRLSRFIIEEIKKRSPIYDAKDTMVIKSFEEIYNETEQKLGIKNKAVFIEHVKGHLKLSEKSILIGVACKHRDEAYRLSRFIIEEIKKRSPIWKKEHYENEDSKWLKGISLTT